MKRQLFGHLILVFIVFLTVNCAVGVRGLFHTPKTPEEKAWLDAVLKEPLEFEIKAEDEKPAWSRAQSFLALYSGVQTKIATDSIIETEIPRGSASDVGYKVIKVQKPDGNFIIKVQWVAFEGDMLAAVALGGGSDAYVNLHILAHYIRTGDLPYPWLIRTASAPERPKSK